MSRIACGVLAIAFLASCATAQGPNAHYFPDRFEWQRRSPQETGLDPARLKEAIGYAVKNETNNPRDQALTQRKSFGQEPHSELIGPTKVRAPLNGVIIHRGYVVAEWGDTASVDMTHSVTKT